MGKCKFYLFIFIVFSIGFFSSCQDEIDKLEEPEQKSKLDDFCSVNSRYYDIDGGTLPEVEIVASHKDMGGASGDDPKIDWWYPPMDGNGSSGWEGGGGVIPSRPPTVKLATDLVTLFPKGSSLSKKDLEKLNSEFKRMLVHCEYEALNNLLKDKKIYGGKIVMLPEDVVGLLAVNWPSGDLNIIGGDALDATNLAHEWVHLAQGAINPSKCRFETAKYEGMMEFELVVFQDVMHYAKHGTSKHLQPETDFPTTQQWIANLTIDDSEKDKYYKLYDAWIKTTFMADGNNVSITPDKIAGTVALYNYFMNRFFIYSRNYNNRSFKIESDYGFTVLATLINAARINCYQ